MAYHFSAHQFEDQYNPRKLGNWEYPKWYPERPRQRFKSTKIIADNNGHLLEGIKRENAWGNFVGTWELPRRITREYVKKLTAPPERLVKLWEQKKPCQDLRQEPTPQPTEVKPDCLPSLDHNSHSSTESSFERRNKSCSALDLRPRSTKLEPLTAPQGKNYDPTLNDVKPGVLDEKVKNILDSVEEKEEKRLGIPEFVCKEIKALPGSSRMIESDREGSIGGNRSRSDKSEGSATTVDDDKEPEADLKKAPREKSAMGKSSKASENDAAEPSKKGHPGLQIAKRFHDENLRHKPLPDVIDDPVFKALNSAKQGNPGGALNVAPVPSAIGWKPYAAPRPTECSKLKVFRPKTCVEMQKSQKDPRPKTGDFSFKKRFLPIDLAICWDLKPHDPSDEPKRSPHIDGNNGSAAPAVFSMIRPNETDKQDENIPGSSQALAERITKGIDEDNITLLPSQLNGKVRSPNSLTSNREAILSCIKPPKESPQKPNAGTPESLNSISPNAAEYARRHPKTAWTKEDTSKVLSDRLQYLQRAHEKNGGKNLPNGCPSESPQMTRKKYHQSTPNLVCSGSHCGTEKSSPALSRTNNPSKIRSCTSANVSGEDNSLGAANGDKNLSKIVKKRNCSACKKSNSDCSEAREKPEFKAAFKAGVPRSDSTNSGSSSAGKSYKVPKMRLPYAKRSYSIGTLAPPFSLWRESNGQEYPEHWRLASVYQHSYKPINCRKRPLLASVYQ